MNLSVSLKKKKPEFLQKWGCYIYFSRGCWRLNKIPCKFLSTGLAREGKQGKPFWRCVLAKAALDKKAWSPFGEAPPLPPTMFFIHKLEISSLVIPHNEAQNRCWNAFTLPLPSDHWAFGSLPVSHCYKHSASHVFARACAWLRLWHFSPLSESDLWRCLGGTDQVASLGTVLALGLGRAEKTQLLAPSTNWGPVCRPSPCLGTCLIKMSPSRIHFCLPISTLISVITQVHIPRPSSISVDTSHHSPRTTGQRKSSPPLDAQVRPSHQFYGF